jgi:protein-disulfide isomerase
MSTSAAPITIEVYADYACWFCKQFMEALVSLNAKEYRAEKTNYHFLPLPQHDWAQMAAEESACVLSQDKGAFWAVTIQLYKLQSSISSVTLPPIIESVVASRPEISVKQLHECMSAHRGALLVLQDRRLADAHGIHATPTVFINGKQFYWRGRIGDLEEAVNKAKEELRAATEQNTKE